MAIDEDVTFLAELRRNMVSTRDLRGLGLTQRQIDRRADRGRLFAVHRGVFSVVPPPYEREARATAACLALPHGVISFATAARLHGIRQARGLGST